MTGRFISDGKAIDVVAPGSTAIESGEMYRIDNFTGFAMVAVSSTEAGSMERDIALERSERLWRVSVPSGTCGTRGIFVKWSNNDGSFKKSSTDVVDETVAKTVLSVAQVEGVRNSRGFATLKLCL